VSGSRTMDRLNLEGLGLVAPARGRHGRTLRGTRGATPRSVAGTARPGPRARVV
jgi:hypothetical protein